MFCKSQVILSSCCKKLSIRAILVHLFLKVDVLYSSYYLQNQVTNSKCKSKEQGYFPEKVNENCYEKEEQENVYIDCHFKQRQVSG